MERAKEEAVLLWSLASAEYPMDNSIIQKSLEYMVVESVSEFSFNARRATEVLTHDCEFKLHQPRYQWAPDNGEVVDSFWDALNRIIHSRKMEIGFVELPQKMSKISGGSYVIPFIRIETDRRPLAFVDIFALSHCYLYEILPRLLKSQNRHETIH